MHVWGSSPRDAASLPAALPQTWCRGKKKWESECLCLDCHSFSFRSYRDPDFKTPEEYEKDRWQARPACCALHPTPPLFHQCLLPLGPARFAAQVSLECAPCSAWAALWAWQAGTATGVGSADAVTKSVVQSSQPLTASRQGSACCCC